MHEIADYDGAWKEAIGLYLQPLVELCFPAVARRVDWRAPTEFLDTELQEVVRDAELGKQRVDKLVRVRQLDGTEEWVLIHIEVQAQPDENLPRRVYQYHHRIADRFGRRVATLVVLSDERPGWCPDFYEEELWGCRLRFEYPVCKLLDLARAGELESSRNPAAVVVAAHLAAQATRGNMELRSKFKWQMTRRLYEQGWDRKDVLELFRLINWLMVLPRGLELAFRSELAQFEQEKTMPYITPFERYVREEGREEGLKEGREEAAANILARQARKRFHVLTVEDEAAIRRLPLASLEVLSEALLDFSGVDDLHQWLASQQRTNE
jgi:hypothetical protein